MTQAELYQALKAIGFPVAYGFFSTPVTPPFITYQFSHNSDLIADNQNYLSIENFQIELYTTKKDPAAEALVQNKLKELRLPYNKIETWLDDEKLYQIIYEIQLIGG